MVMDSSHEPKKLAERLEQRVLAAGADGNFTILPIVIGPFDAMPFTPDPVETEKSDLLFRVLEKQVDYGR